MILERVAERLHLIPKVNVDYLRIITDRELAEKVYRWNELGIQAIVTKVMKYYNYGRFKFDLDDKTFPIIIKIRRPWYLRWREKERLRVRMINCLEFIRPMGIEIDVRIK